MCLYFLYSRLLPLVGNEELQGPVTEPTKSPRMLVMLKHNLRKRVVCRMMMYHFGQWRQMYTPQRQMVAPKKNT